MPSAAESEAIRELPGREQALLLRFRAGKSPEALAQIYREYEGPNGILEAVREIEAKVVQNMAAARGDRHVDERPLLDAIQDAAGEDVSVSAGRMNGAARMPEHVARTPPMASPPPIHGLSSSGLADTSRSPATAKKGPMPSVLAVTRNQTVIDYLRQHGPCSQADLLGPTAIPRGSITAVVSGLLSSGQIVRHSEGRKVILAVPGQHTSNGSAPPPADSPTAPQKPARAPRSAPMAPPPSFAGQKTTDGPVADPVAAWLSGVDRDALRAAIEDLKLRLDAYEQFADALEKITQANGV